MSICFGECLYTGFKKLIKRALGHPQVDAERLYQGGIDLREGKDVERNLRGAFRRFEEASGFGHKGATKELADCYFYGRGCEKDQVKAAELGNPKTIL